MRTMTAVPSTPRECTATAFSPRVLSRRSGTPGICYDNAAAESFNATIKKELIYQHVWRDAGLWTEAQVVVT